MRRPAPFLERIADQMTRRRADDGDWEICGQCGGTGQTRKLEFRSVNYDLAKDEPDCVPRIKVPEPVGSPQAPGIEIPCKYHGGTHIYVRADD